MKKLKLGFLASHGGSNMQAIIDECKAGRINAVPAVVISNNSNSMALERARNEGVPAYHISQKKYPTQEELDNAIIDVLDNHKVDLVILAGYMKKLGSKVIQKYNGKILNIHPALLPKYGGEGMYGRFVHEAVIKNREKESGCTVHLVDEVYDHGKILGLAKVPVFEDDTPETLAERVLEQEHKLYPEIIRKIASGDIVI